MTAESAASARPRGTVYTFYSFKGGVGRSMALANTAALLAKWGRSVLIVDFDLEAPGIEKFFEKWLLGTRKSTSGLVDIITSFADGQSLPWRSSLLKASLPEAQPLHILSAGRDDSDYGTRLRAISWETLFAKREFGAFLETLRQQWTAEYDFVLVDSRTGITDIGGICTIHLPDVLVTLFTTTEQGLSGVKDVMEKSRKAHGALPVDRRRLLLVPVPARDESRTEYKLAAEWRARFASELGSFYDDWIPRDETALSVLDLLKIPYVAFWSFGERLPVLEEDLNNPDKLAFFYQLLARLVIGKLDLREVRVGSLASQAAGEQKAEAAKRLLEADLARQKAQREVADQEAAQRERDSRARRERYLEYVQNQWQPAVRRYQYLLSISAAFGTVSIGALVTLLLQPPTFGLWVNYALGTLTILCVGLAVGFSRKVALLYSLRARFEVVSLDDVFGELRFGEFVERVEWAIGRNPLIVGLRIVNPLSPSEVAAAFRGVAAESTSSLFPSAPSSIADGRPPGLPPPLTAGSAGSASPLARATPAPDRAYDVFISFRHEEFTMEWIREFLPLLSSWLSDLLGRDAEIFADMPTSTEEPLFERVEAKLHRSSVLLAVVTPAYLRSGYATREVEAFAKTGRRTVPLLLRGTTESLPRSMRDSQFADFREFAIVGEGFRKTSHYVEFQMQIRRLAEQLAEHLSPAAE